MLIIYNALKGINMNDEIVTTELSINERLNNSAAALSGFGKEITIFMSEAQEALDNMGKTKEFIDLGDLNAIFSIVLNQFDTEFYYIDSQLHNLKLILNLLLTNRLGEKPFSALIVNAVLPSTAELNNSSDEPSNFSEEMNKLFGRSKTMGQFLSRAHESLENIIITNELGNEDNAKEVSSALAKFHEQYGTIAPKLTKFANNLDKLTNEVESKK